MDHSCTLDIIVYSKCVAVGPAVCILWKITTEDISRYFFLNNGSTWKCATFVIRGKGEIRGPSLPTLELSAVEFCWKHHKSKLFIQLVSSGAGQKSEQRD